MSQKSKIKIEQIKGLEEYIDKKVEEKVKEKLESFFEENGIDLKRLKESLKPKMKAIG